MFDIVFRDALVVDGTGAAAFRGDVAVEGDRIAAVGDGVGRGRRDVDVGGRMLSPGWVDVHSHYDGQATWDPLLTPSGAHGVTTTVMGNCGVGFAPARPGDRQALITLMEGVEDIPGSALAEALPWTWESFPEYLDVIDATPHAMDMAVLVPHSAVRAYVMGPHDSIRDAATARQLDEMAGIVRGAVDAGAIGMSTSRTKLHLGADGKPVPGSFVEMDELLALSGAVRDGGGGMLQLVVDWSLDHPAAEFAWIRRLAEESGQPVAFVLVQFDETPDHHREVLRLLGEARADGVPIHAGVASRPVGMLINLDSRIHPFSHHPSFREIAGLPLADKLARMRDASFRARLLAERSELDDRFWRPRMTAYDNFYALGDPPEYEPAPERSIGSRATAAGRTPLELVYDLLTAGDGNEWLYFPFINYASGSLDPQLEMMRDPGTVLSLSDGGAHCGLICDASAPTFQLTHWVQSRDRGARLGLEEVVEMQTQHTAKTWGFADRGTIAAGMRADLNVIDLDRLRLRAPRWADDLPAGGRRLMQEADGYDATYLAGVCTWERGEPTGERPGRLVRSAAPPAFV